MRAVAQLDNRAGAVLMPLIIETPRPADNWWYDPLVAVMIFAMNVFAFFVLPVMADGLIWLFHEGLRY